MDFPTERYLLIDIKDEIEKNKDQKKKTIIRELEIANKNYKIQGE